MKRVQVIRWSIVAMVSLLVIEFPRGEHLSNLSLFLGAYQSQIWHDVVAICTFSFGYTKNQLPVASFVSSGFWSSFELLGIGFAITVTLGLGKGIYDGLHAERGGSVGATISSGVQFFFESLPDFLIIFLIELAGFMLNRHGIKIYFVGEEHGQFFSGTFVPALVLALLPSMYLARMTSLCVEEQLLQQYIVTALAKGLRWPRVVVRHIVPNVLHVTLVSSIPVIGMLLSNLVLVEYLFYRNGLMANVLYGIGIVPGQTHDFDSRLVLVCLLAEGGLFLLCAASLRTTVSLLGYRLQVNAQTSPLRDGAALKLPWQFIVGTGMLGLFVVLAVATRNLMPNPDHMELIHFDGSRITTPPYPPSARHWLGTDIVGRDLLSRALFGTLPTFRYVGMTTMVVMVIGTGMALLGSLWKRRVVRLVTNLWNHYSSLIPGLVGALLILEIPGVYNYGMHAVGGTNLGRGLFLPSKVVWSTGHTIIFIAVVGFMECGRVAYQLQSSLDAASTAPFMEAADLMGGSPYTNFVIHHLRPFAIQFFEHCAITFSRVLLLTASLGFFQLSFGQMKQFDSTSAQWMVVSTSHDWGGLFAENARDFMDYPWVMLAPALCVTWTVFAFHLAQIGLRRWMWMKPSRWSGPALSLGMRMAGIGLRLRNTRNNGHVHSPR